MVTFHLSLAELEIFDPGSRRGNEQRFCCPLPACANKSKTKEHRSLTVNISSGAWQCMRCGASGLLQEFHTPFQHNNNKSSYSSSKIKNAAHKVFEITPTVIPHPTEVILIPSVEDQDRIIKARKIYSSCLPYIDNNHVIQINDILPVNASPAANYLYQRNINPEIPLLCGVRYHPKYCNYGPAVIFPIYGYMDNKSKWELMAIQGRFINPAINQPKVMTTGKSSKGIFITKTALKQINKAFLDNEIFICEAPIDALSLAECGFSSIALIGTNYPDWLPAKCAGKRVFIATDADDAGDKSAIKLCDALAILDIIPMRLKPQGVKDWNEFLQKEGQIKMTEEITRKISPYRA
jgi:hypothetical protein